MEALKDRYLQLTQSYNRLRYMVEKFEKLSSSYQKISIAEKSTTDNENELITHRDAVIKRFEFCYELTWKLFQLILREKYSIEANSPRKVFQECFTQNIFSREEAVTFLEMIDARNATTHKHDESTADAISQKILEYYPVLRDVTQRVHQMCS